MNAIKIIGGIISVLERVPGVNHLAAALATGLMRRLERSAPPVIVPLNRKHFWGFGLADPPTCAYCHVTLTDTNQFDACAGAVPWPKAV